MASTRLSRTPASAGSRTTWTWSAWIKLASFSGATFYLENAGSSGTNDTGISIEASSRLEMFNRISGSVTGKKTTTRKFRDTNAWYHIVVVWDTTNATADDRIRFYVNGERETAFDVSTNPSSSENSSLNNNVAHDIGSVAGGGAGTYFDGEMAHVHFIDGTAYDADTFGETDSTTGIWKPKTAPSVTYGTNGFFLKFENSGSMGTDSSGNANNFTVNGTLTQTEDTPSNVFATWNPLFPTRYGTTYPTFTNGNLTATFSTASAEGYACSTLGVTQGKWYWEIKINDASRYLIGVGENRIAGFTSPFYDNNPSYGVGFNQGNSLLYNATSTSYTVGATTNDIIQVALDMDNHLLWFGKNGTWLNSATQTEIENGTATNDVTTAIGTQNVINSGEPIFPLFLDASDTGTSGISANFGNGYFGTTVISSPSSDDNGNGLFAYAPPTGFLSLCTKSINAQEYN